MDGEGLEHPEKWAVETFGTAELGDLRRTDRLVKMATALAENPSASLPESMRNWGETLAAYRFLDNEAVTHEQIMLPHWMTTREEAMQHSRILLLADTTDINLSSHETVEGLERRSRNRNDEIDRASERWLAQEKQSERQQADATIPLATTHRVKSARRADCQENSESQTVCVFTPA